MGPEFQSYFQDRPAGYSASYKHNVKYKIFPILIHLILRTAYLKAVTISDKISCSFRICWNVILYSFFSYQ